MSSPAGRNYGQPAPAPEVAFRSDLAAEFEEYLESSTNHSIFTAHRMQQFVWYLEHPLRTLTTPADSARDRARDANTRNFAIRYFEVDDGCLYRSAEFKNGENGQLVEIPRRYVALKHNAFKFITDIHRLLQHYGIQKTYERVAERYYSITRENVAWVVNRCTICNLKGSAKNPAPVTPIVASRCMNRVQIDLMDFRTTPDSDYNWVCQMKDQFSRYITLDELEDKEASSVAAVVERWIGRFGRPRRM